MNEKINEKLDIADDFLYEGEIDEKASAPYAAAVKSVVLGSLAIVLPLFALLFYTLGSTMIPVILAAVGLIFAIVGLVSAGKGKKALGGTLCEGMAKAGRTVSIIGLIASALILTYIVAMILLSIVVVVLVVAFYVVMYVLVIMAAMS